MAEETPLLRLALSAGITEDPQLVLAGDVFDAVPELRRHAAVREIPEQPSAAPAAHFIGDFGAELEVEPTVVDRPTAVVVEVIAVAEPVEKFVERAGSGF